MIIANSKEPSSNEISISIRLKPDFNDMGAKQLNTAESTSPYFDRVVPHEFAEPAMTLLRDFMKSADVGSTTEALEALRLEVYQLD